MLQPQKKYRENCKHQFRMFTNEMHTQSKPKNPERAPGRQKSTQRHGHQTTKDQQENVSTFFFLKTLTRVNAKNEQQGL